VAKIPSHRSRVARIALDRIAVFGLVASAMAAFRGGIASAGDWAAGFVPSRAEWPSPLNTVVGWVPAGLIDFALGLAVAAAIAYVIWRLVTLWGDRWLYKDPWNRGD
jgi:hypothetical protein